MKKIEEIKNTCKILKEKINNYYAAKSEKIDNSIKNDAQAIRLLTSLENAELTEIKLVNDFILLCEDYFK